MLSHCDFFFSGTIRCCPYADHECFIYKIVTFANCFLLYHFSLGFFWFRSDYINEVLHENPEDEMKHAQADDWEGGLTFIAKSSRK